ncbi:FIG140336: TPR domain protein [hydrothermal vent metagenome]|uniref:FIG140336: TPR domain protein n=1 Tax=hydrothermal vent metagenome TaxID=652676 RepID=A0A3B0Y633_9ZZZZ
MQSVSELKDHAKTLIQQQQFGPAQEVIQEWLLQEPDDAEAHYLMAGAYGYTGKFVAAENHCRQAIKLQANYFEAIFRLANALDGQSKTAEALQYYQQAIDINPAMPHVWNNMGACQISINDFSSAEQSYRQAINLGQQTPQFYFNLALALIPQSKNDSTKMDDAINVIQKGEQYDIELADQLYFDTMLGINFLTFNAPLQAEKHFRNNIVQEPDNPESHLNLALSLVAQNREAEALQSSKIAQQSCSDNEVNAITTEIAWTMGLIYLGLGEYQKAWPLYESRWYRNNKSPRNLAGKRWNKEALKGKTLFLYHEQGYGDNLQFARYFPQLKQLGATVVYECQKPLYHLFESNDFIDRLVKSGEDIGAYDFYLPLASLPGMLGTTLETIPYSKVSTEDQGNGYLSIATSDVNNTHQKIDQLLTSTVNNKRVGIFWRGSGSQANDKRPCSLKHWEPLLKLSDISFISLQKDYVTEQDEALFSQYSITDMRSVINDFSDTAYIIKQLDLVITIDTSVAHLAGSLGANAKVLLAYASDWRWGRNTDTCAWYPSLTLYRQSEINRWDSVINQLVSDISEC